MIVFGTKGVTYSVDSGQFLCPQCGARRTYSMKRVRRFFALFGTPLIPLDTLAEHVECGSCRGTWPDDVLRDRGDPSPVWMTAAEAEFGRVILRVMVMMTMADGEVAEEEVALVQELYQRVGGEQISAGAVAAEARAAHRDPMSIEEYLASVGAYLNDSAKDVVVKAALLVAGADRRFEEGEAAFLDRIATGLDMSRAHIKGIIAEMSADAPGEEEQPPALSA